MIARSLALALAVSALAAAPSLAASSPPRCTLAKVTELPVTMTAGLSPLVPVKINGQEATLVADAGATYSIINGAAAARLGLKISPAPFNLSVRGVTGNVD